MKIGQTIEYILSGIVVIAIIAVLVSQKSTTPSVLQALGAMLTNVFATIVAPISSGSAQQAANSAANNAAATTAPNSTNSTGSATHQGVTAPTISPAPDATTSPNTGSTAIVH